MLHASIVAFDLIIQGSGAPVSNVSANEAIIASVNSLLPVRNKNII